MTIQNEALTGRYAKLRDDLRLALQAGRAAEEGVPNDRGSCNLDATSIALPRWVEKKVVKAATEAGTTVYIVGTGTNKQYIFEPDTSSQGYARTANAEAMTVALKTAGYTSSTYYRID